MGVLLNVLSKSLAVLGVAAVAFLFLQPLGPARSVCPHIAREGEPRIDAARFGVEMPLENGRGAVLVETDRVPLVPGTVFAWRVHMNSDVAWVHLREELVLPQAPAAWEHTGTTRISADRRVAITEEGVATRGGWVSNSWALTEGDPPGEYQLRIFVDGRRVKTFRFEVDPPGCGSP